MSEQAMEHPDLNETQFRDGKGRLWTPHMDCRVARDFEKIAGYGLFEAITDALEPASGAEADTDTLAQYEAKVYKLCRGMFGKLDNILFLLYESCRPGGDPTATPRALEPGANGKEGNLVEVSYDEFCASVPGDLVDGLMKAALILIMEFFPKPDDARKGAVDEERPFGNMSGETPSS